MKFLASHPRLRIAVIWVGLIATALILFQWVEPAVFESPYNNF
jgi:hypothetical protein